MIFTGFLIVLVCCSNLLTDSFSIPVLRVNAMIYDKQVLWINFFLDLKKPGVIGPPLSLLPVLLHEIGLRSIVSTRVTSDAYMDPLR